MLEPATKPVFRLPIDIAMLGSAGMSLSVFQFGQALGVSEGQLLAAFMGVCAVCYMLLRREVDRVMKAVEKVEEHERRLQQLENGSGPVYLGTDRRIVRAIGE